MEQLIVDPENEIIGRITLETYISDFDPEIRNIFYNAYGKNLENMPEGLLQTNISMERFLECLLMLTSIKAQMLILMRLGFVSGTPMTIQETAEKLEITRERVRQIESSFLKRLRPRIRCKKRISDFYGIL